MSPVRIQRRRTKGWRMPEGAVYVGRPTEIANQVIAMSALPIPVTPTTPPSAYVEVLGTVVVVSSGRHDAGNIAFLVGIIDDQIMVLHGCPSEQEPVVPAAPSGFSPLAVVRLKPYQVCVQHGDIEVVS